MKLFSRERTPESLAAGAEGSVSDVLELASERIREIVDAAERAASDIDSKVRSSPGMQGDGSSKISRERLVAELAESLVARAGELSREAADLADVLERASQRLNAVPPQDAKEVPKPSRPQGAPADKGAPTPSAAARSEVKPESVQGSKSVRKSEGAGSPRKRPNLTQKVSERFGEASPAKGGAGARFKRKASSTKPVRSAPSGSTEGLRLLATQMAVAGSTHDEIEARLRDEFGVEDASELLGQARIAARVREP